MIVPHAFGDHGTCFISWCKYLKDPVSYRHSTLPHGKDLEGEDLKKDLQETIEIYCENAEELAPLGSSQANEALNNTIGSKAPKIRHYGSSESHDYRMACAVNQKNIGHSYVRYVMWTSTVLLLVTYQYTFCVAFEIRSPRLSHHQVVHD